MKKIGILFFCLTITVAVAAQTPISPKTYLLVHGGWHGAWCWKNVIPLLEANGSRVVAFDLPGRGTDQTPASTVNDVQQDRFTR